MARRIQIPDSVKVDLTQGDWLILKKRLTAGEARRLFAQQIKSMPIGASPELNPEQLGLAVVVAYLLDWGTFTDSAGKPLVVRDQPPELVASILNALDRDDFIEVRRAVEAHDEKMDAEREQEKNAQATGTGSSVTSLSPESITGATNGSLNSR